MRCCTDDIYKYNCPKLPPVFFPHTPFCRPQVFAPVMLPGQGTLVV